MKYVLLLIYLHGNPRLPITTMQEFDSRASCNAHLLAVLDTYRDYEKATRRRGTATGPH